MTRYYLTFLFLLICGVSIFSQEGEVNPFEIYTQDKNHKVLIVPFESKMYVSSLDAEIAKNTGMDYFEIREKLRFGISNQILLAINKKIPAVSMIHHDDSLISDLNYVYNSIGYKYTIVPDDEDEVDEPENLSDQVKSKITSLINKSSKPSAPKEKKEYEGGKIYNGEVYTTNHYAERFMNTSIHNATLLDVLNKKYRSDLYIFINELNIGKPVSSLENTSQYFRKIKVHYTVFNQKGKEMEAGSSSIQMPHYVNDIDMVIRNYFSILARDLCSFMPEPNLDKNTIIKENEDSKKAKNQRKIIHGLMVE
jgi:hypothetical protein